ELQKLISDLSTNPSDIFRRFYEAQKMTHPCQGDIFKLASDIPVIDQQGKPGVTENNEEYWLLLGNTCDLARDLREVSWTQAVPLKKVQADTDLLNQYKRYK